jgi:hypothetical protein
MLATTKYLKNRRDRLVGALLGQVEPVVAHRITDQEWAGLRAKIIDAVNSYHDSVLDLVKVDDGVVHNDALIDVLERVEASLKQARRPVPTAPLNGG